MGNRHLRLTLVDGDGHVVLTSKLKPPDSPAPEFFRRMLDRESEIVTVALPAEFDGDRNVVLATDTVNEIAETWSDISLALAVLITFCTIVLGLVYLTLVRSLRPLADIHTAFVRVGRGDYSPRIAEAGATELAHLAREFNQMVTRLKTMKLQNHRLNEQLANVQDEDRAELARELHDEIGPFLFAVGLDASAMHQIAATNGASAQPVPRVNAIRAAVAHMQKHLKAILGQLRPALLLDLGLAQAMDNLVDFWKARHPDTQFDVTVASESFGGLLDACIYRIVRESTNNALRHGHRTRIAIGVRMDGEDAISVEIVDDGGRMKPSGTNVRFGIIGMQERVARLGGTLTVQNRLDGTGVKVTARLPRHFAPALLPNEVAETAAA